MTGIRSMPVLSVSDVVASAAFYERLGFERGPFWGDPPGFCIMGLGTITLALQRASNPPEPHGTNLWSAYLYVSDVAALHAACAQAGAQITEIRRDTPYGVDDFDLTDPDGHVIAFGQDTNPSPQGPGL